MSFPSAIGTARGTAFPTAGRAGGLVLDPDAEAWILARLAAGDTDMSSPAKIAAVNNFVLDGKGTGDWWAQITRCWLYGSGVAAANAISFKSVTSGAFSGTVTHAATAINGDGSTGRFDSSSNISAMLASVNDCALCFIADTQMPISVDFIGSYGSSASAFYMGIGGSGNLYCQIGAGAGAINSVQATRSGVFVISRTASNAMSLYRLNGGTFATLATNTTVQAGSLPALAFRALAVSGLGYNNHPLAGAAMTTGLNATRAEAFARAWRTLVDALNT